MQICDHVIDLLLGEAVAHGWHHVASAHDCLFYKAIVGHQSARQVLFLKNTFQAGALEWLGCIGGMADRAIELKNTPALCLLSIQSQLGIGF